MGVEEGVRVRMRVWVRVWVWVGARWGWVLCSISTAQANCWTDCWI